MFYLKITPNYIIPERLIKGIANYKGKEIIKRVRAMKANGRVQDVTYGKKINTVIFLTSDEAIITNVSLETIMNRIKQGQKEL